MRRIPYVFILALAIMFVAPGRAEDNTYQAEADRLAELLNWHAGSVVAEIGAGGGELTLAAAKRVGPGGRIYTTEIDPNKLAQLETLATDEKTVTALQAGLTETNLPPGCCDSIFMREVYHHLTKPAEIDASLFRSLKPGGLMAVVDLEPGPRTKPPPGVPENRGGHGMPRKLLIEELTVAGFHLVKSLDEWPHDRFYCVVVRKPGA